MMDIQNIIYELLYLGIRTEVHKRWKNRNIKTLRIHIFALNELQKSFLILRFHKDSCQIAEEALYHIPQAV